MPTWAIHLVCVALVATDQVARALRIWILDRALGHPIRLRQALAANLIGDAACAVTPMRLGGEPTRLATFLHAGVPATASFVAIAFEVITMWPMVILTALGLALRFAPGWIDSTAPALLEGLERTWSWLLAAVVVSFILWLLVRRRVKLTPRLTRRPWRRVRVYWRRMRVTTLIASALLGFLNVASRTAILPVLMLALPEPPPLGPALLGSFALLYSQLALPTPSGMGIVDLGLLAGAAGATGEGGVTLLLWWRFYTGLIGVGLGTWAAVRVFGWEAVKGALRGKSR
ncbi:MAG TPA: lysylphosphatidylglycerol synthase transmembrane domain-containing protein [Gemmatimonadales bacterium]